MRWRNISKICPNKKHEKHISNSHADTYKLYANDSKTEHGIASTVYIKKFQYIKKCIKLYLNFTAEIYGILQAMNYHANVAEENISIATDSKSSWQAIRTLYSRNHLVQKIKK